MDNRIGGYKIGKMPAGANMKTLKSTESLPQKVDLRKFLTSVEMQIGNSCVANAMAGAYEYLAKRELGDAADVSRLYIYYNARYLDGTQDEDSGSYMQRAIEGLIEYGACSEEMWPNDENSINAEPHTDAYNQGAAFRVVEKEYIDTELDLWRETLAEGYPIAFALNTFDSFDEACNNKGRVPMPKASDNVRETHGWHAMLCVGYSDIDRVFIVRNSWSEEWGDKGYCYIPYDYMIHPDYNSHDSWIIKAVENLDYSEGVVVDDEESMFYNSDYLIFKDFYVYTEQSEEFSDELEELILEYVKSEQDFFFDWETLEDDGGVYISLKEFYLSTEEELGFWNALDELCIVYGGEDGYDYTVNRADREEEK
jgi:C1A family cysteine protease